MYFEILLESLLNVLHVILLYVTNFEMCLDFVRFFIKTGEQIRTVFVTETRKLYEELKALPVYDKLKNAYNNVSMKVDARNKFDL